MSTELKTCETNGTCAPMKSEESFVKPQYTVREVENAWEVGVVMPGVNRERVEVSLDKDVLTVTGRVNRDVPEDWKVLHRELSQHDYQLKLHLNFDHDGEKVTARVEDGILSLKLPVAEASLPKTISVN